MVALLPQTSRAGDPCLLFGGDYNPEQWDEAIWAEDVEAMVAAGVNLVTVGVFSWSALEPSAGRREFGWLDRIIDLLWSKGIAVDLATPTASPPRWLSLAHPETLPLTAAGVRLSPGSRNHFCPSSTAYRAAAASLVTDLVAHYAEHPAVQLWHVGNEFGQVCYCDSCADAFRAWVKQRYGTLEALNEAWGTAVWSQQFSDWAEVLPPREAVYVVNPAHVLDWRRYCSDALLALFDEQAALIRAGDLLRRPVTTNFMGFYRDVDAFAWASHLDVVSDDSYPDPGDPDSPVIAALTHDLTRSVAGGPWLLIEQATSAVSWRPHNLPKSEGRMRADAFRAVAHGSDGVLSFQWRASRAGAERFHSALVPHAGTDTRLHRSVVRLGADLARLAVAGEPVPTRVGILFDWSSWWAAEERGLPSELLRVLPQLRAWYRPLWRRGLAVDIVHPAADLAGYDLLLGPQLFLLDDAATANLRAFVSRGGTLALGSFSAVVDANATVRTGRFPVGFTDLLGAGGEEWWPLPEAGTSLVGELSGHASVWGEWFPLVTSPDDEIHPATVIPAKAGVSPTDHLDDEIPGQARDDAGLSVIPAKAGISPTDHLDHEIPGQARDDTDSSVIPAKAGISPTDQPDDEIPGQARDDSDRAVASSDHEIPGQARDDTDSSVIPAKAGISPTDQPEDENPGSSPG
ncbi:MAG: beta-galactosidase [Propionicimonas sp.]|uniref:beta-galactosidase n=1 Tax=Propionicimonas sp. TaxID=1955623 RepID=UPI003D0F04B1